MSSLPPTLQELDDALLRLRRLWLHPARRRRFLAELGEPVELATLRTLRAIDLAGGEEPSVGDVAAALVIDASTASRLVDQAVSGGYATRRPSQTDGRRSVLELTTAGADLLERSTKVRERLLAEVTTDWSTEDVATLTGLLERLHRDFERLDT